MDGAAGAPKDSAVKEAARVFAVPSGPTQQQVGLTAQRDACCGVFGLFVGLHLHACASQRAACACAVCHVMTQLSKQQLLEQELPYIGGQTSPGAALVALPQLRANLQRHWKALGMQQTRIWGEPAEAVACCSAAAARACACA